MEINTVIEKAFNKELENFEEQYNYQFSDIEKEEILAFAELRRNIWETSSKDTNPYAYFAILMRSSMTRIYHDKNYK